MVLPTHMGELHGVPDCRHLKNDPAMLLLPAPTPVLSQLQQLTPGPARQSACPSGRWFPPLSLGRLLQSQVTSLTTGVPLMSSVEFPSILCASLQDCFTPSIPSGPHVTVVGGGLAPKLKCAHSFKHRRK